MNRTLKGILLAALVLVVLEAVALSPIRIREMLAIYGVVIATLVFLQRGRLLGGGDLRIPVAGAFVLSLAPALALAVVVPIDPMLAVAENLLPTLTGWCVFLALLLFGTADGTQDTQDLAPSRTQAALALAAVFALLTVVHWISVGRIALIADEVVYLVQSRWIRPGQWTQTIDADIAPFFLMRQIDYIDGQLVGQYPAGWPMLLAAFRMIGLEWWSPVILGTASVALTYVLSARLHSRRAGVISALLLATSQIFLVNHAGYMAHPASITSLLGATLCLLIGIERAGWRRISWWAAAGSLFGVAVATRPLTGLTVGVSIGVWMLYRAWQVDRRAPLTMAGSVALGGLAPAALFIAHNLAVTGGPLVMGYDAIHKGLYHLGFGTHGYMVLDADVNRVPLTFEFTLQAAVKAITERLAGVVTSFVPTGLLMTIVAAAVAAGYRIRWGLLALFSLLPVAHFFYRYSSLRLYAELLPFVFIAVATMLLAVRARWPRLAAGLLTMIVISQLTLAIPVPDERPVSNRPWFGSDYGTVAPARRMALETADSLARVHRRIVLFSREGTPFDNLIDRLYVYNGGNFDGPILVARDRGARNAELIRRHPDRVPFLVQDQHGRTPALFTRIESPF